LPPDARTIRRELEAVQAAKLLRVVAVIDAMGDRGTADALLIPLRARLARLRPPRLLRFERLLFQPLDPVIVPGPCWQPDSPTIPRHALRPIAQTVRSALGARATEIDALIGGCSGSDHGAPARIGGLLWPEAADALAAAVSAGGPAPSAWVDAGLRPALFTPMVQAIGTVWHWHCRLQAIELNAGGIDHAAIAAVVAGIAHEPILTQAMMMALLLTRLPRAASLLQSCIGALAAGPEQAALRTAGTRAIDGLTAQLQGGGLEAQVAGTCLADAAPEVRRLATLLDELLARATTPTRRAGIDAMRQRLDTSCRARFQSGLLDDLLTPLQVRTEVIDGPVQTGFEATARSLRDLETEARRIGGAELYDALLGSATQVLQLAATQGVLTLPRQVRLVEILNGPEAAMALLDGAPD
jgi:hypothetical protein